MVAAFASWLVFAIVGVAGLVGRTLDGLGSWTQYFATGAETVRKFVIAGDRADFISRKVMTEIPYPDQAFLASLLEEPYIRRILPAAVRQPLPVEPRSITDGAFISESRYRGVIPDDPLAKLWSSLSDRGKGGQGQFVSRPMRCEIGHRLTFQVAGYLGWEHQYLALKDLSNGRDVVVRPRQLARETWTDASVACPQGPFEIVAIDGTPDSWFAFREPVEVGLPSMLAEEVIGSSLALCFVAVAMLGLAARWT
jgi:hypothetical protein